MEVMDPRCSDSTSSGEHRRVHEVPPTPKYQQSGETKILDSLLKEAQMTPPSLKTTVAPTPKNKEEDEKRLQKMLEKYQNEMKHQLSTSKKSDSQHRPSPISHSQPCLIASGSSSNEMPHEIKTSGSVYQRRASASDDKGQDVTNANNNNQRSIPSNQKIIQSLRDENLFLKTELDAIKRSLSKFQQIEYSYSLLEKEYEYLSNERKKQESLEITAIIQLEKSVKKLTIERDDLQLRLEKATTEPAIVANLMMTEIQQRQELFACKERQKMEIEAQNQTLEEQRNHIAMLEKALANSQERLAKREKKCEELASLVTHADELRKQLNESWEEQQRRELSHESEKAQWEMEKTQLRMQLNKDSSLTGSLSRITPASTEEVIRLRKNLQAKDDKIMQLERMVADLTKTLNDESERRRSTLSTITDSFEARIKKLEDEKFDRDLIINELKQERDKYCAMAEKNSGDEALHRMEEIRQKIQERKKKGRMAMTGGLSGSGDHNRTSSGSMVQTVSIHGRTASSPFETKQQSSASNNFSLNLYKSP